MFAGRKFSRESVLTHTCILAMLVLSLSVGQGQIITGSYEGNNTENRVIAIMSMEPGVVIVKGNTNRPAVIRTATMDANEAKSFGDDGMKRNLISSFVPYGFVVGDDKSVNGNNKQYYWVAFATIPGELKVGSYEGDDRHGDRSIAGLGFAPAYVMLLPEKGETVHRSSTMQETESFEGKGHRDLIVSLDTDGFTISGKGKINKRRERYHYVAWSEKTGRASFGSYVGNRTDHRNISGLGLIPNYVIVASEEHEEPVQRMMSLPGDATLGFDKHDAFENGIQALNQDGFELGTDKSVNKDRKTYHYMAFGSVVLGVKEERPVEFQVQQNYPNPFNPSTQVAFTLSASGSIRLEVYDVLGRKVRDLANGVYAAGNYTVTWDATNTAGASVAGGVYYARLTEASGGSQKSSMIKMLLMK